MLFELKLIKKEYVMYGGKKQAEIIPETYININHIIDVYETYPNGIDDHPMTLVSYGIGHYIDERSPKQFVEDLNSFIKAMK